MTGTDLEPTQNKLPEKPSTVELDPIIHMVRRDKECADAIRRWTMEREKNREEMAKFMGDATIGTIDGEEVILYAPVNSFNSTEFRKSYPDLYKVYTRKMEVERLDVDWLRSTRPDLYEQFQSRPMKNTFSE